MLATVLKPSENMSDAVQIVISNKLLNSVFFIEDKKVFQKSKKLYRTNILI